MFEIIAMLTMFADHLGAAYFPDQVWFRIIGRVAMPLYTYGLVQGYKYTRSFNKYLLRLILIALISQPFYALLFHTNSLNMVFTLIVCLLLMKAYDQIKSKLKYIIILLAGYILEIFAFDYGSYALILMFIYRLNKNIVWRHNLLNLAFLLLNKWVLQLFSFVPSMLIAFCQNRPLKGTARNFYRAFYPLHLAFLYLMSLIL